MKKQKKWIKSMLSILIAGIMLLGMTFTTLAAGEVEENATNQGSVTINNTVADKKLTYYQIFSATKNETAVAYTLNSQFEGFFTSNPKYGCTGLEGEALSQKAYEYVSQQKDANARKALSQELLTWTLENKKSGKEVTTTETTTVVSKIDYGFYLFNFAGATNVDGITTNDIVTTAMLINVIGPVTINMKSSYPVVDKTVDDQSTAIGETVTYTLTSHVPDMTGYKSYVFKFKDILSKGLTFGGITEVKIGKQELIADSGYTLIQDPTETGKNEITIEILDFINYKEQAGTEIVVKYTATVNENAVVGMNPNTNEATVEYSNDPSVPNNGVPSVPDKVDVHTFDFTVNKYFMADQQKTSLSGVGFRLYKEKTCVTEVSVVKETEGNDQTAAVYRKTKEAGVEAITPASGKIQFKGLDAGTYYLKETTTPDGYNKLTGPITIEITPTYDQNGKLTQYEVKYTYNDKVHTVSSNKKDQSPTIEVENKSGTELPNTGGVGAVIFTIAGVAILAVVMLCSMRSKKRRDS